MWWWISTVGTAALCWAGLLFLPWRPWSTREVLDVDGKGVPAFSGDQVTLLVPARNEEAVIGRMLSSVAQQGSAFRVVLVDDHSTDNTVGVAQSAGLAHLTILKAPPLPAGWTGKLWALEQGRQVITTPYILLLDADLCLAPGLVQTLLAKVQNGQYSMVSLMAAPALQGYWDRWLMPAFVYFFKLLYPFGLVSQRNSRVAAAAGGCVLLSTSALVEFGGFGALRGAVIDDCTLAWHIKKSGKSIWLGLTHSLVMVRCNSLADVWRMVARTAFTQLHYSVALLLVCTAVMVLVFIIPVIGLFVGPPFARELALSAFVLMALAYIPTLRFYGLFWWRALFLPVIAILFLAMTWTSALWYARGVRSQWKGRAYVRPE